MDCLRPPVSFQFPDGVLNKTALFQRQLQRQGHLFVPPTVVRLGDHFVPILHLGDHNPSPIQGLQNLRSVKVQAVVDGLGSLPDEIHLRDILPDEAESAVPCMELQAHGGSCPGGWRLMPSPCPRGGGLGTPTSSRIGRGISPACGQIPP